MNRLVCCCILLLLVQVARAEVRYEVHNPDASYVDVKARRVELHAGNMPERVRMALAGLGSCKADPAPALPSGQHIPPRYLSGSHGPVNPLEHTLSVPYYHAQEVAAWGANRYLATGDASEARCVIEALLPWARAGAMLNYNAHDDMQEWYQTVWTAGSLALSVSVVRSEPTLDRAERDEVIGWLHKVAAKALYEERGSNAGSLHNNHACWRGMMATAVGVISADSAMFARGVAIYSMAMGEIDANGAFPLEMQRHELSTHYQSFAINPLVMTAELAMRQGYDLYALTVNGHRLADAVAFLDRALTDPTVVRRYTPEPQGVDKEFKPGMESLCWAEAWQARWPSAHWAARLTRPAYSERMGGSTTLAFASRN